MDFCSFSLFSFLTFLSLAIEANSFINKRVSREFDLSSQLVRSRTTIIAGNANSETDYEYLIEPRLIGKIAYLAASVDNGPAEIIEDFSSCQSNVKCSVALKLNGSDYVKIVVDAIYTDLYQILPEKIVQTESHSYRNLLNTNINSLNDRSFAIHEETQYNLWSPNVIEANPQPHNRPDKTSISYSFPNERPPLSYDKFSVHYENNAPFLKVRDVVRYVEVTSFGDVIFRNQVNDLFHCGAKLSSGFSRQTHMFRSIKFASGQSDSAVEVFEMRLPQKSRHVFYRDHLGNISTSTVRFSGKEMVLDLRPRFPLFGGWRTSYTVGYTLRRNLILRRKGNEYKLRVRIMDSLMDNQNVEHLELRIALPRESKIVDINTPYRFDRLPNDVTYGYLDIIRGKPTIVLSKSNLVNVHSTKFIEITFLVPWYAVLIQPVLVFAGFLCLFLTIITIRRLRFGQFKDGLETKKKEN
ncbi:hypothetical protein ACOME3_002603 [Neoechinorhynchus agilis]